MNQAILLFFRREDSVSIHTLAAASLMVLYDLADYEGISVDDCLYHHKGYLNKLGFESDLIKEFQKAVRFPQNFFKHAIEHLKAGINSYEHNSNCTQFYMFEAINLLKKLEPLRAQRNANAVAYLVWFYLRWPEVLVEGDFKSLHTEAAQGFDVDDYESFLALINDQAFLANLAAL